MKALTLLLVFIPLFTHAQTNTDCGNDYVCFYQKEARDLEAYRYQQLEFQEQQLNEMRRQNSLLEQEIQSMNERQNQLENNYPELQEALQEQDAVREAQEEQMEEDQFRIEEIP